MSVNSNLIDLLRLVFAGADLSVLTKRGLRYSQISQLMEICIHKNYLGSVDGKMVLTARGVELVHSKGVDDMKEGGWIRPFSEHRKKKAGLMNIYLPSRSTVSRIMSATSASGSRHRGGESSS